MRMKPLEEWCWLWRIIGPVTLFLEKHRLKKCTYCLNTGEGCDCGACYLVEGSYGYSWCMNMNGCPHCGRDAE
jgi:hypothetical protein